MTRENEKMKKNVIIMITLKASRADQRPVHAMDR